MVPNKLSGNQTIIVTHCCGIGGVWVVGRPRAELLWCSLFGPSGAHSHTHKSALNPNPCAGAAPKLHTDTLYRLQEQVLGIRWQWKTVQSGNGTCSWAQGKLGA